MKTTWPSDAQHQEKFSAIFVQFWPSAFDDKKRKCNENFLRKKIKQDLEKARMDWCSCHSLRRKPRLEKARLRPQHLSPLSRERGEARHSCPAFTKCVFRSKKVSFVVLFCWRQVTTDCPTGKSDWRKCRRHFLTLRQIESTRRIMSHRATRAKWHCLACDVLASFSMTF